MPWLFLTRAIIIKPTEKPRTPSKAKFVVKIRLNIVNKFYPRVDFKQGD